MTMKPRSVFTPSVSSPRLSILPCTPTAEIIRSAVIVSTLPSFSLDMRGNGVAALLDLGHLGVEQDLHALLLELLLGKGGDFGILDRHDLRQKLDHGHVHAHGAIEGGELDADRARSP